MLVVKALSIKPTAMHLQTRGFVLCMVRFSVADAPLIFSFAIPPKIARKSIPHVQPPINNRKKRGDRQSLQTGPTDASQTDCAPSSVWHTITYLKSSLCGTNLIVSVRHGHGMTMTVSPITPFV